MRHGPNIEVGMRVDPIFAGRTRVAEVGRRRGTLTRPGIADRANPRAAPRRGSTRDQARRTVEGNGVIFLNSDQGIVVLLVDDKPRRSHPSRSRPAATPIADRTTAIAAWLTIASNMDKNVWKGAA